MREGYRLTSRCNYYLIRLDLHLLIFLLNGSKWGKIYRVFASINSACPFKYTTLFLANSPSTPEPNSDIVDNVFFRTCYKFKSTPLVVIPKSSNWFLASANLWLMFSKVLEGMQPTLRQVPPNLPLRSMEATFKPCCANLIAAVYPNYRRWNLQDLPQSQPHRNMSDPFLYFN